MCWAIVSFSTRSSYATASRANSVTMPTNRPHSVEAVRDCAFLLTIGPSEVRPEAPSAPDQMCDSDAVRRVVRQVRREWPAAQERYGQWPAEGGDEMC